MLGREASLCEFHDDLIRACDNCFGLWMMALESNRTNLEISGRHSAVSDITLVRIAQ